MFQTGVVEKVRTYILYSIIFFVNRAFYEIMWKDVVQSGRPQMTLWRMRFAYWTPKTANTHSVCVILIFFPLQQWLLERASILRYTHTACLVLRPFFVTSEKTKVFLKAITINYQTTLFKAIFVCHVRGLLWHSEYTSDLTVIAFIRRFVKIRCFLPCVCVCVCVWAHHECMDWDKRHRSTYS
jgi:hypothetical protein